MGRSPFKWWRKFLGNKITKRYLDRANQICIGNWKEMIPHQRISRSPMDKALLREFRHLSKIFDLIWIHRSMVQNIGRGQFTLLKKKKNNICNGCNFVVAAATHKTFNFFRFSFFFFLLSHHEPLENALYIYVSQRSISNGLSFVFLFLFLFFEFFKNKYFIFSKRGNQITS